MAITQWSRLSLLSPDETTHSKIFAKTIIGLAFDTKLILFCVSIHLKSTSRWSRWWPGVKRASPGARGVFEGELPVLLEFTNGR